MVGTSATTLPSGGEYRFAIMVFFVLSSVLGVPLSRNKTLGGNALVWVGFELLLESDKVGISQRRAEWFVRWATEMVAALIVHMKTFEEGLGRIMFFAGALAHERPFSGPLYEFLTQHPHNAVRRVPANVSFILELLSRSVSNNRHYDCDEFFAQASSTRAGIVGWFPRLGKNGRMDLGSRWKSHVRRSVGLRTRKQTCILEALAVLVSLKLYYGDEPGPNTTSVTLVPTFTDNRGNGSALNKLMSTRFPSSALQMELSVFLKKRKIRASVEWAPRESNKEADVLLTVSTPSSR